MSPSSHRTIGIVSALLFILGCLAFYIESLYNLGVTFFLAGSLLMLVTALGPKEPLK